MKLPVVDGAKIGMYTALVDLRSESDVEQKLIFPLLTTPYPEGLGYASADVFTKATTRRLPIGKGASKKLYVPDYTIVIAGLPLAVVEAKAVGEPLDDALAEARLYAHEINALFPHGINPCARIIVCNGEQLWTAPIDVASPEVQVGHHEFSAASIHFARFVELCSRVRLQEHADHVRSSLRRASYVRPVTRVGGAAFQNEELPQNTFGATIVGDYGNIFNPKTAEDRERVVREAYIASYRHQRYVEPIDRLIRNAVAPSAAKLRPIEDSSKPREIASALSQDHRKLENQILLLVGSVGAGKSTFVDYLSIVALPDEVRKKTAWVRINLNNAPLAVEVAYDWIARAIESEWRNVFSDIDFDHISILENVFSAELNKLKKGPLSLLDRKSSEARLRIADRLAELQTDPLAMSKAMARFVCGSRRLLMVIVLDNCDKRSRDEQLVMFQLAHWIQSEYRCLIILPLRDVTYDVHRHDPPLDTALKQFVFRIEPPAFSDVLQARARLAFSDIAKDSESASNLTYQLPNGIRVSYPAEDQALYLATILRSLYAHDRFVRQVMTGLAGRDVRLALEIFLEFCLSGHIGEDEIYKIRFMEGQHVLPLSVVARVLLRMQRRFYDGNAGYLKNVVQCDPEDPLPDHFVRLGILKWFEQRVKRAGPAGVEGFHRVEDMVAELAAIGHDATRVRQEMMYLVRQGCLVAEHLRTDAVSDEDLVKVTASGVVHLQLMVNPEYLAACAEDTWIGDLDTVQRIASRITRGLKTQFDPATTAQNAIDFVSYLRSTLGDAPWSPEAFLDPAVLTSLNTLREAEAGVAAAEVALPERLFVGGIPFDMTETELRAVFAQREVEIKSMTLPRGTDHVNRGFAFLEPASRDDVLRALNLDAAISVGGRRLRINEAHRLEEDHFTSGGRERSGPSLSKRIYVANLPFEADEGAIRSILADLDITAVDIYVLIDRNSQRSRGACFVELQSLDEAARAIGALNGLTVGGRSLLARPAEPRERNSTH